MVATMTDLSPQGTREDIAEHIGLRLPDGFIEDLFAIFEAAREIEPEGVLVEESGDGWTWIINGNQMACRLPKPVRGPLSLVFSIPPRVAYIVYAGQLAGYLTEASAYGLVAGPAKREA